MAGFTKLFASITDSTIWCEDAETKVVWITMLAMADGRGQVLASVPGLAARARISLEATERALDRFQQPDKYSRSQEAEGRRIETIDGGWHLINYAKYREAGRSVDRREYLTRKQAERRKKVSTTVNQSQPTSTGVDQSKPISEAEAEAEDRREDQKEPDSSELQAASEPVMFQFPTVGPAAVWGVTQKAHRTLLAAFPGVSVDQEYRKAEAWLIANPTKRKTARGMGRFLFGWMERVQNRQAQAIGPPRAFVTMNQQKTANTRAAIRDVYERHGVTNGSNGAGANGSRSNAGGVLSLGPDPASPGGVPRGPGGHGGG